MSPAPQLRDWLPRRLRATRRRLSPRHGFARAPRPPSPLRPPREELAEATAHGKVYLRRLRHAQLTLSLLALTAFGAIFGVLPLVLYLLPLLDHAHLLGIPLSLWLVVVPMLPVFFAIGWVYARRADALDDAFRDLVER